jgi:hypothetical protein
MLNSNVLVLNRSYLPIHVTSVKRAFSLIYQDVARAVDREYQVFDFASWCQVDPAEHEAAIGTPRGPVKIPRVIVLLGFDGVPKRHVRYSRVNIFARDDFTCQYCGARPHRSELNLDHVVPRSLGGRTTWENVVCSCVDCNRRKGGRTPAQARLCLRRSPARPRWSPVVHLTTVDLRYQEWRPFLRVVDRRAAAAAAG